MNEVWVIFFGKALGKIYAIVPGNCFVTGTHNRTVWMLKLLNQKSIVSK